MSGKNDIKIEFDTLRVGKIIVEELKKENDDKSIIENINTSMSVQAFPTAKLSLNATPKYPNLIGIKSGDFIKIFMREDKEEYQNIFVGFLISVKVKTQKDKFELQIECTSEFFKLQEKSLSSKDFKSVKGLRQILSQIVEISKIKGEIIVDDNINNEYELNNFKNFPALALINSICYELDLAYDIVHGDKMRFSKREDILHNMFNSKPIELGEDKIISSEFEQ